ncbi:MAG: hypothetical protein KGI51_07760, partial [Rhodospirillales bacterium]|nr:hypothetical protein [Rhodospirillales bacterium]
MAADIDPAREAREASVPAILIQLAPRLAAGIAHGRHDAIVLGRVVAAAPIETIALLHDETELARAEFPPEPDPAPGALHVRAFLFVLPRPVEALAPVLAFSVRAGTADGAVREVFCRAGGATTDAALSLEEGPAWVEPPPNLIPPLVLYVERAALDAAGQLVVNGWGLAAPPLLVVQAFLDGERAGTATLGQRREDVAAAYPGHPDAERSGFALQARLGEAARDAARVRLSAIAEDGTTLALSLPLEHPAWLELAPPAPAPEAPPAAPGAGIADTRQRIDFYCDTIETDADGAFRASGWAVS